MSDSIGIRRTKVIAIGEDFHLRRGKDHIAYAGMVSDDVYSIVQKKSNGYQGFAWNLYYSKRHRDITIDEVRIYIERVTPEEIELRVT
jgi:hypothetical protein